MTILIFLLVLSFLVIIHELGHFLTARWARIKVEEFGLGYPPKAKRLFTDKFGTAFTLNWLPFGGFVRMFGEDGGEAAEGSFTSRPAWKRLVVVLAGAFINFVFGVAAFGAIYSRFGIPSQIDGVKIESVTPDSPAALAGISEGFLVKKVIEADNEEKIIGRSEQFINIVQDNRGQTITLISDTGESRPVYVRTQEETPEGQGSIGVGLTDIELRRYPWWQMPFRGMWVGLQAALNFGWLILQSLGMMLQQLIFRGQVPADVAGPVGIVYAAEQQGFLREGFWAILNFAAILSINLAIINVLPFPALDGGRATLLGWEIITRKRVNPKVEAYLNTVGFSLLIGLILLISFRDISRVLQDANVQNWWRNLIK